MHGNTDAPLRVGLVGVTGYTGMELTRLLAGHPDMRLTVATSRGEAGKRLGDIYCRLPGILSWCPAHKNTDCKYPRTD